MKKNTTNSSIKCNVATCKYLNEEEGLCCLNEIKVGCTCDNDECCCKEETVCESFKEKKKDKKKDKDSDEKEVITDTVYEVQAEDDEDNEDDLQYEEEEA